MNSSVSETVTTMTGEGGETEEQVAVEEVGLFKILATKYSILFHILKQGANYATIVT